MLDADGLPLGQIRFERSETCLSRAVVSFSLDPVARGHGLACELLQLGLAELSRQWGKKVDAYGEIRASNHASAKTFLRAKFMEVTPPRLGVRCFSKPASSIL